MTTRGLLAMVGAVLLLAGCGGGQGSPTAEQQPLGSWQLIEGEGPDGEVPLVDDAPVTLQIEDGEAGGTAACNSYGGSVEIGGERLRFQELFQTEMACPGEGVMASEAAYLDALHAVDRHARDGERLVLTGEETRLVFEPREQEPADNATPDHDLDPDEPVTDQPEPEDT